MLKILRRLYGYCFRYKAAFFLGTLFLILGVIALNINNILYKLLIDNVVGSEFSSLIYIIILVGVFGLLDIFLVNLGYYFSDMYIFNASRDARSDVFSHLHQLDFSFHANKKSGSLISTIRRGDGAFFGLNHEINREMLMIAINFIFAVITFTFISVYQTITLLIMVTVNLLLTKVLIKKNIERRKKFNDEEDNISHIIVDNLINYDTVKYFAKEDWEKRRLSRTYVSWMSALWGYANTFRMIDISTGILIVTSGSVVILLSLWQLSQGLISAGDLVLVITFVTRIFPQITSMIYKMREVAKQYTDIQYYFEILDYPIEVPEKNNAQDLQNINGDIKFKDVTFGYENRPNVIENINLHIKPGESIAFVGESGAGKTTLTKLLLRFYDVNSGAITIDDQDIRDVSKSSLRANVGVVPQEPVLFNDTIGFNIGYPKEAATLDEIRKAARLANLDEFIESLPDQYDSLVGERGIKLSGGQKQRLAIARMFLANPPIVIFDEATSQLDSNSEQLIQEAFWKLVANKTTIIIAHRLSTIMRADRIVVIAKGQIVQEGKHSELINVNGIYKDLWDLQRGAVLRE